MKVKPIRRINKGGKCTFSYWSYPITHTELMRFVKLHVEPSRRNQPNMSIVRFFIEGVTNVLVDRGDVADALLKSGYTPINPNDSQGEWMFKIQLRNVAKVYSAGDSKNAIYEFESLPQEIEFADKKYRLSLEKNEYSDELLIINDNNSLIGMYII